MTQHQLTEQLLKRFETYLESQTWKHYFSSQEWSDLVSISAYQDFDVFQQAAYWTRLLTRWDTRSLEVHRPIYQELRQILRYYLSLLEEEFQWSFSRLEPVLLKLSEAQVDLQQKQLLFWRFEHEQKQNQLSRQALDGQRAEAEFYNLSELTRYISKHFEQRDQLIHESLDGVMGVLDASWTALYVQDDSKKSLGHWYTLHFNQFEVQLEQALPQSELWQKLWNKRLFQTVSHDFQEPSTDLAPLFPNTRAVLAQTLQLSNQMRGLLLATSEEISAFHGFKELFGIFATHLATALQNANLHAQVNELAIRDALTGAFNRRHLEERLRHCYAVSKRYSRELSVLMIDIDHFKKLNDGFGHQVGDRVLKKVSDTIADRLRSTDILGRYGGEEFLVILQETGFQGAEIVARDLVKRVAELSGEGLIITVSVGFASFPQDAFEIEDLIRLADQGLYLAKDMGRNRVGFAGAPESMLQ